MLSKETITFLIRYLIPYGRQPYRFHCKYRAEGERSRTEIILCQVILTCGTPVNMLSI